MSQRQDCDGGPQSQDAGRALSPQGDIDRRNSVTGAKIVIDRPVPVQIRRWEQPAQVPAPDRRPSQSRRGSAPPTRLARVLSYVVPEQQDSRSEEAEAEFHLMEWGQLRPGDVVLIESRESVPADVVVLLSSSAEDASCYVDCKCLEGASRLLMKHALPLPSQVMSGVTELQHQPRQFASVLADRLGSMPYLLACAAASKTERVHIGLYRHDGSHIRMVESQHFLPQESVLLLTDWVVGVVIYTGQDTKFALNGGWQGAEMREEERKQKAEEKRQEALKKKMELEAQKPSPVERAAAFESRCGMRWRPHWTNVPDDGNCLMTAFWLGFKELLTHYPECRLGGRDEPVLSVRDSEEFRSLCCKWLREDQPFRDQIKGLFELFISGIDEAFLVTMEDFFALPESIQERILKIKHDMAATDNAQSVLTKAEVKQEAVSSSPFSSAPPSPTRQASPSSSPSPDSAAASISTSSESSSSSSSSSSSCQPSCWSCSSCTYSNDMDAYRCNMCGTRRDKPDVDYDMFVNDYLDAVESCQIVNGRRLYMPLGASELSALARLLSVRLQTMSSEGVLQAMSALTLDEIDPKAIEDNEIHEFGSRETPPPATSEGAPVKVQRIIRLLNVNVNHYYVHLPLPPEPPVQGDPEALQKEREAEKLKAFGSNVYWQRPMAHLTQQDLDDYQ